MNLRESEGSGNARNRGETSGEEVTEEINNLDLRN
jgi:hypothetical protein